MSNFSYPNFTPGNGYLTEITRNKYIAAAIGSGILPRDAHRMPQILSLVASDDTAKPIQFWQLFSVLGQERIVRIVQNFYERVFDDEPWFTSVFSQVGGVNHHINTQSGMWLDVMGCGPTYHGGEFRLSFHHTHNAMQLMNDKGAERWVKLMVETLNDTGEHMTDDTRVRPSINTFLSHFFAKYADEYQFDNNAVFGDTNPAIKRKINFMNMTTEAVEALSENELREALAGRGVDISLYHDKKALVNKALML